MFYYLASPYSKQPSHEEAAQAAARATVRLMQRGITAYSPIAHTHHIAKLDGHPPEASFWHRHNVEMIRASSGLIVLLLEGWETSAGVAAEIREAKLFEKPIRHLAPGSSSPQLIWTPR